MNRFLCGVEGVRLAGGIDEDDPCVGGVCLDGSLIVVACVEMGSGERFGGVG